MDQITVVSGRSEKAESGKRLIERLVVAGFDVQVAFWAKPTDEGKWFLYLASPIVDEKGPATAYRLVHAILRKLPALWIDPLEIRVVGLKDSLSMAASAVTKPTGSHSPFADSNPMPFPGLTWFGGAALGGVSIDGAYIYPPLYPSVPS